MDPKTPNSRVLRDLMVSLPVNRARRAKAERILDADRATATKKTRLAHAEKAGPEMLHVETLRQANRHLEADIYSRAHAMQLRDQRETFNCLQADEPESTTDDPPPPEAA